MKIWKVGVLALLLCLLACPALAAKGGTAVIKTNSSASVYLRAGRSTKSEVLGWFYAGTSVKYSGDPKADWVSVSVGGLSGYMKSDYLETGGAQVTSRQPTAVVTASRYAYMRQQPTQDSKQIGSAAKGEQVTVLGVVPSGWMYVQAKRGTGYISGKLLEVEDKKAKLTGKLCDALESRTPIVFHEGTKTLSEYAKGASLRLTRFAVADVDRDGQAEAVVQAENQMGIVVLKASGDSVVGYTTVYRGLMNLKTDGTFEYSSGVQDNGVATAVLKQMLFGTNTIHSVSTGLNGEPRYFVDGKISTRSAFEKALEAQAKKKNATWYDLTQANVEAFRP